MVRRIGKVLRLQAEAVAALIDMALLSGHGAVKKISCVELHSGLGGGDFHDTAAGGFIYACRENEAFAFAVDGPVVVIAVSEHHLVVGVVDAGADSGGSGEIERSTFHRTKFAGRDKILVDRW